MTSFLKRFSLERALLVALVLLQVVILAHLWRVHRLLDRALSENARLNVAQAAAGAHMAASAQLPRHAHPGNMTAADVDEAFRMVLADGGLPGPADIDGFDRMHNGMQRMLAGVFDDFIRLDGLNARGGGLDPISVSPAMDMREYNDCYVLAVSLPGVRLADLSVVLDGRVLGVAGMRNGRGGQAWSFEKRVQLPGPVTASSVRATLTNGVLRIVAPKEDLASASDKSVRIL